MLFVKKQRRYFANKAQSVENLPAVQATWVQSLGREDPLEKEMATHSSILAWESHGQRSLASCSPWVAELNMAECAHMHTYS